MLLRLMDVILAMRWTSAHMGDQVRRYRTFALAAVLMIYASGPLKTGVPEYTVSTDSRVINTTQELSAEFPLNPDYNGVSGNTLGVGKSPILYHLYESVVNLIRTGWAQFTVSFFG